MNNFFGIASPDSEVRFKNMSEEIADTYGCEVNTLSQNNSSIHCGYTKITGEVTGKATFGNVQLIYSGFLYLPLPGWEKGSPLDNADSTAYYLLQRYQTLGKDFLQAISGQYVIAICDNDNDTLVIANDPGGFRKLFYYAKENFLAFSTNLASINAAFTQPLEIDRSLEDFLLGYEFLPSQNTIFKDVKNLAPGTILAFKHGNASFTKNKNISNSAISKCNISSEKDVMKALYNEYNNALQYQCPSDNKIAVMLGGFDSALVASSLTKMGKNVETFSFYFEDESYNQKHTDTLAKHLGIKHNWIKITPKTLRNGIKDYSLWFNQPVGQMHYVLNTAYVCKIIRNHGFEHCFTGDGCDEIFLGYPTVHSRAKLFLKLGKVPNFIANIFLYIFNNNLIEDKLGHVARVIRNVLTVMQRPITVRSHITHRVFDEKSLQRLRTGVTPKQSMEVEDILAKLVKGLENESILRLAYRGKSAVGLNKNKIEGCSYFSGLTLQSPFQYPGLCEFVKSLPEEYLRPQTAEKNKSAATGKYILMRMAEEYNLLPPEIIYQKKASPVTAPVDGWYMEQLNKDILEAISYLPFAYNNNYVENLLKPKFVEEMFRKHVGLGRYSSHTTSLLATYANYNKFYREQTTNF